ncbi:glycerophosphodiester phosphodiesterase [Gracilibacillus suaedae]|uniref:glycerophosphodiester phosphodiesterase n=1 Tax=Gracilibacillus suaedae TaxID=2820273 RepID=UPI001ABDB5FB|nr:glycerophosphodiester phosphodiesterase family protein [Gracilibacillus suaedae]
MSTIIYAHRGASKHAPENTMPAFELAYKHGADGIETDVQLTKDNIPVLIHDEQLNRTTNGIGFVKDFTYDELEQLDAGSWKSSHYKNTKIPTLDDLLAWNQDKQLKLNIELKNNIIPYQGLEDIICQKLVEYQMTKQTVISSFNHDCITKIHDRGIDIDYALLTGRRNKALVPYSKKIKAKGIHISYRLLSNRLVTLANDNQLYVAVYTVNSSIAINKAIRLGCHALFTDIPKLAIDIKKRRLAERN